MSQLPVFVFSKLLWRARHSQERSRNFTVLHTVKRNSCKVSKKTCRRFEKKETVWPTSPKTCPNALKVGIELMRGQIGSRRQDYIFLWRISQILTLSQRHWHDFRERVSNPHSMSSFNSVLSITVANWKYKGHIKLSIIYLITVQ